MPCDAVLTAGFEMGARIRDHDWAATPLGPMADWPASLSVSVGIMLGAGRPMGILWGQDLLFLYNDALAVLLGPGRHPGSLGRPARFAWPEAFAPMGGERMPAMPGTPGPWRQTRLVVLPRDGGMPARWLDCSHSPIPDPAAPDGIGGALVLLGETSAVIRDGEGRDRALLDRIDEGFCILDVLSDAEGRAVDCRYVETNRVFQRVTGHGEVVGRTIREVVPDIEPAWIETFGRIARDGVPVRRQGPVRALGRSFDIYAFRIGDPAAAQVAVLFTDITARRAAEERQAFLLALSDALRPLADPQAIQSLACRMLRQHLGLDRVDYSDVEGEEYVLRAGDSEGMPEIGARGRLSDLGAALLEHYRRGETVAVEDVAADPRLTPAERGTLASAGIGAFAAAMLIKGGRWVGIFCCETATPRAWTPDELGLVREVAERVWAAAERARAEAETRRSEALRRLALDATRLGTFIWHVAEDRMEPDPRAREILGLPPGRLAAWREEIRAAMHPEDRGRFDAALASATAPGGEGEMRLHLRLRLPGGGLRWVALAGRAFFEGAPPRAARLAGTLLDITAGREAEARLRESEAALRTLADAVPAMVWMADAAGRNTWTNARWHAYTGLTPEQARGEGWIAALHPDDAARILPRWACCRREAIPCEGELRYRRAADGAWRWHAFRALPLCRPDGGVVAWYGCDVDIHDLKEAEAALRDSEARLRLATEGAGVGTWTLDPATGHGTWSAEVAALLGEPAGLASGEAWLALIHPEDRAATLATWRQALRPGGPTQAEYRTAAPAPDGGERWLLSRWTVERDAATGRAVKVAGVLMDITPRRRAEAHRELLLHELNHRVKNTLATVQSIAAQTLRTGCEPETRRGFQDRLISLAKAHDLLTGEKWDGASLDAVARHALRPHMGGPPGRIAVEGPALRLTPKAALAFSMAFHELATNAAKYGALSGEGGRVSVGWSVGDGALRLDWRESGGPPVRPPERRGFGTRLIEGGLAHELGGTIRLDFAPAGLACGLCVPLPRIAAGG